MTKVGVRELKANLSRFLKRVEAGEQVLVTDRKNVVAVLLPYSDHEDDLRLRGLQLVKRGTAWWTGAKPRVPTRRETVKGPSVSAAVLEDRN